MDTLLFAPKSLFRFARQILELAFCDSRLLTVVGLGLALSIVFPSLIAEPPKLDGRAAIIEEKHKAGRDSIHSLSCRVNVKSKTPPNSISEIAGKYWRSLDRVRVDTNSATIAESTVVRGDEITSFDRMTAGGATQAAATRRTKTDYPVSKCDLAGLSMMLLDIPGTMEFVSLEQLVAKATSCTASDGGHRIRLRFDPSPQKKSSWRVDIRLSPNVNYLIDRVEYRCETSDGHVVYREHIVESFAEPAPSHFFPQRIQCNSTVDGKESASRAIEFSDIKINTAILDGVFQLEFPNNFVMHDEIRRSHYRIDSNGNRISAETPTKTSSSVAPGVAGRIGSDRSSGADLERPTEVVTTHEPISWSRFLLPFFLVLLTAVFAVLVARRLRTRGQAST